MEDKNMETATEIKVEVSADTSIETETKNTTAEMSADDILIAELREIYKNDSLPPYTDINKKYLNNLYYRIVGYLKSKGFDGVVTATSSGEIEERISTLGKYAIDVFEGKATSPSSIPHGAVQTSFDYSNMEPVKYKARSNSTIFFPLVYEAYAKQCISRAVYIDNIKWYHKLFVKLYSLILWPIGLGLAIKKYLPVIQNYGATDCQFCSHDEIVNKKYRGLVNELVIYKRKK